MKRKEINYTMAIHITNIRDETEVTPYIITILVAHTAYMHVCEMKLAQNNIWNFKLWWNI